MVLVVFGIVALEASAFVSGLESSDPVVLVALVLAVVDILEHTAHEAAYLALFAAEVAV